MYTTRDVERLAGVPSSQLRRWHRSGLLTVEKNDQGRLSYAFADLVAVRAVVELRRRGASTQSVRQAVQAIRDWRPDISQPLASVKVSLEDRHVVIGLDGLVIEPNSGQLLLSLPPQSAGPVEAVLDYPSPVQNDEEDSVDDVMALALAADERGDHDAAERHYRRCLTMDPSCGWALINLGNLLFKKGEKEKACSLYEVATRAMPEEPAPWYNLANALDDLERSDQAAHAYREALSRDPAYADAHFNLGLLLEKLGQRGRARTHWEAFLALAPDHPSAEMAAAFLEP